jgi:hypothetical protein
MPLLRANLRRLLGAICGLAVASLPVSVKAHGPFDHSARLFAGEAQMELTVTMGADAASGFLSQAAFPPEEIKLVLSMTSAQVRELPVEMGAKLFEITTGNEPLTARRVTVRTDGLDTLFTLVLPRPASGPLNVRALYPAGFEPMKQGSFVAFDENNQPLGAAFLSRASDSIMLILPARVATDETRSTVGPAPETPIRPSFGEYLRLGVEHILLGFDHLLFLGALLIGVRKIGSMLWVITCFTLAHSVTLALAALELVTVSSRIVEPLIALSIIIVAVANLVRANATADRFWLAGGFGLIHGFGFASVLRETGLAQSGQSIVMPLFSFNLGVELGQLAVAAVFVPLLLALRRWPAFARYGTPAVSVLVITLSGYWFLQRTLW